MNPTSRAKIVHLTSVHRPFDVRIFHKECKTLAEQGYEVVLVAPHERSEVVEGVRIRAVPESKTRRERMTRTVGAVLSAALAENADLYHFHDPELIPVGIWLKMRGKRVVYDVHDDVPRQILSKSWIGPMLRSVVGGGAALAEGIGARLFDGILAVTPVIAHRFPKGKTVTVKNFPIVGELDQGETAPYRERPAEVAYVGVITRNRGAQKMVEAMEHLPQALGARLMLAGTFYPPGLEEELNRLPGWVQVEYLGWQSRPQVAALLGRVRMGAITSQPTITYVDAYPTKLFEYMSIGIPVVCSDFPLLREIVESVGCGILVNPLDPEAIASAIQWLLEHPEEAEIMGRRGQEAVRKKYNWDTEAENLLAFYEDLLR
jgi:glycosyltransferase involved in cell wall biosynthesis